MTSQYAGSLRNRCLTSCDWQLSPLLSFQTKPGVHSVPYSIDTGGYFVTYSWGLKNYKYSRFTYQKWISFVNPKPSQTFASTLRLFCSEMWLRVFWYMESYGYRFVGALAKLRKATISFAMPVCPSVCPRGTTRLPLDGFLWNLIFEYFSKSCSGKSSLIKIWEE
jgi:hypothetical protein